MAVICAPTTICIICITLMGIVSTPLTTTTLICKVFQGSFKLNFGAGLYYDHPDFYIGMAIPNMLASDKVRMDDEVMTSIADNMFFYSMVGYYWRATTDFTVKPRFQTRFGKGEKPSTTLLWQVILLIAPN